MHRSVKLMVPEAGVSHSIEDRLQATRNLRVVFWLYTIALLVATHYPRLKIAAPQETSPDKLLHFFAFGGWAVVLWSSGYVRRPTQVAVLTVLFGVFDELTQAIPGLGRTFDNGDLLANSVGAILLPAWIHAIAPTGLQGSPVSELEAFRARAFWRLLSRPINIAHVAIVGLLGGMVLGVISVLLLGGPRVLGPVVAGLMGGIFGGGLGILVGLLTGYRSMLKRLSREDPSAVPPPSGPEFRRARRGLVAGWLGGAVLTVVLVGIGLAFIGPMVPGLRVVSERYAQLGTVLAVLVDLGVVGVFAAFVVRRIRIGIARCLIEHST